MRARGVCERGVYEQGADMTTSMALSHLNAMGMMT